MSERGAIVYYLGFLLFICVSLSGSRSVHRRKRLVIDGTAGNSSAVGDNNTITGDFTGGVDTMGKPSVEVWVSGGGNSESNTTFAGVNTEAGGVIDFENGTSKAIGTAGQMSAYGTKTNVLSTVWSGIVDDIIQSVTSMEAQASGIGDVKLNSSSENVAVIDGEIHPDSNLETIQEALASGGLSALASLAEQQQLTSNGLISLVLSNAHAQGTNSASASVQANLEKANGRKLETSGISSGTGNGLVNTGATSAIENNDNTTTYEAGVNSYGDIESQGNSSLLQAAQAKAENNSATVSGDANVEITSGNSTVNGSDTVVVNAAGAAAEGAGTAAAVGTDKKMAVVQSIDVQDEKAGEISVSSAGTIESTGNQNSSASTAVKSIYGAGQGRGVVDSTGSAVSKNGSTSMNMIANTMFSNETTHHNATAVAHGTSKGDESNSSHNVFIKSDDVESVGTAESNAQSTGKGMASAETKTDLSLKGWFAGRRNYTAHGVAEGTGDNVIALSRSRTDDMSGISNIISKHTATASGSGTSTLKLNGFIKV